MGKRPEISKDPRRKVLGRSAECLLHHRTGVLREQEEDEEGRRDDDDERVDNGELGELLSDLN